MSFSTYLLTPTGEVGTVERIDHNTKEDRPMTKRQEIFYGIASALILVGALIVEALPLATAGMIAVAAASVLAARRG